MCFNLMNVLILLSIKVVVTKGTVLECFDGLLVGPVLASCANPELDVKNGATGGHTNGRPVVALQVRADHGVVRDFCVTAGTLHEGDPLVLWLVPNKQLKMEIPLGK
jgi:hypothetical protein